MHKPSYSNEITKLATVKQAIERYKLGRTALVDYATKVGALRKIGRSVRIDIEVFDKALESED